MHNVFSRFPPHEDITYEDFPSGTLSSVRNVNRHRTGGQRLCAGVAWYCESRESVERRNFPYRDSQVTEAQENILTLRKPLSYTGINVPMPEVKINQCIPGFRTNVRRFCPH